MSQEKVCPGDQVQRGLAERSEWLSPRDISEVFSISETQAWRICKRLPHIRIGSRSIRVAKKDVIAAVRTGTV